MKTSLSTALSFLRSSALLLGASLTLAFTPAEAAPLKIGIVGDSTVCLYPESSNRRGWGQMLPDFFSTDTSFLNLAEGGRSSKTFPAPKWQQILAFKPDFVLIQFGHNDQHAKSQPESTDVATDFKEYLRQYVQEARQAGATPIFVTPPHRRMYRDGRVTLDQTPYVNAMKEVGQELAVPVIDLYARSGALFDSLGEEGSTAFTVNGGVNEDQPQTQDRSHFTLKGATELARLVVEDLAAIDARLKANAKTPAQ